MKVVLAGEALIDFSSVGDMRFQGYCGGSPLNTAVAVSRLGQATGYITQLSTDLFGARLRRHLEKNGIDTRFVLSHPAPTTLAFVEHGSDTNRYQFLARGSADSQYAPQPLPSMPAETSFMHFGSVSLLLEPAATSITGLIESHRDRVTVVFDPNVRPTLIDDADAYLRKFEKWIGMSHLVKLSEDDIGYLARGRSADQVISGWLETGPSAVLLTLAARGVRLFRRDAPPLDVAGFTVEVADTVGAGDTLTAGAIVALLERGVTRAEQLRTLPTEQWRDVMRFAAAASAINCTRAGADPPTRSEVAEFLSRV